VAGKKKNNKSDVTKQAITFGRQKANETLKRRDVALAERAKVLASPRTKKLDFQMHVANAKGLISVTNLQTVGFLVAAGDSWFDYPWHRDVLELLEDKHGYNVESAAHHGDPIEAMAYRDGQLEKIARCIEKILDKGATPKAVLLSGGGNDMAGKEFGMLLNNATSAIHGWNTDIIDGLLDQRILTAFKYMLAQIDFLCQRKVGKSLPILVHGYDYLVPDGRGFLGILAGPWLEPGFREKLFEILKDRVDLMRIVIDRFNTMLISLAKDPAFRYVRYLDLRNTLSTTLANNAYRKWWDNELHPTEIGFAAVAAKFATELSKIP
jgi:hypothetical protein